MKIKAIYSISSGKAAISISAWRLTGYFASFLTCQTVARLSHYGCPAARLPDWWDKVEHRNVELDTRQRQQQVSGRGAIKSLSRFSSCWASVAPKAAKTKLQAHRHRQLAKLICFGFSLTHATPSVFIEILYAVVGLVTGRRLPRHVNCLKRRPETFYLCS